LERARKAMQFDPFPGMECLLRKCRQESKSGFVACRQAHVIELRETTAIISTKSLVPYLNGVTIAHPSMSRYERESQIEILEAGIR
jgi:hypothetical protein